MNDPFSILGLPPRFDLDPEVLDAQHREHSLVAHPDRLRGRPALERRQALSLAMTINEAHRTLKDPISRAKALLEARGHSSGDLPEKQLPPEYLMLTLERRENLREARMTKDEKRVADLVAEVRREKANVIEVLRAAFEGSGKLSETRLDQVGRALSELRYAERFLDEALAVEF